MFVNTYSYDGDPRFCLQYSSLSSAVTLDSWLIQQPNQDYPYYCHFNQGQNAGLVDGVTLTGETSGAVVKVGHVVITQGALGTSNAMGVMFIRPISGVMTNGENLRVSTTTYCVAASAQTNAPMIRARSIYITVENNSIRFCVGGATPTNSAATPASFGVILTAGQNIVLNSVSAMATFSMLNAVSASDATVDIVVNF